MNTRGRLLTVVALGVCLAGAAAAPLASGVAQNPAPPVGAQQRSVEGRVLRGDGERPVAGQYVVLHRIASDSAGPVDSARTAADGRYRFRYRVGPGEAMYIVSTRYAGIAYFTPPLREAAVRSPEGDVTVFDTTSSAIPLVVRGRHFVVSPPDADGTRHVVDVFEVANESTLTRVAGASPHGTWATRIPEGVRNPGVGQGDISPDAVRFDLGRAAIFAPFAPGVKQVVFTYELPPTQASLSLVLDQAAAMVEVLVEGSGAVASGAVTRQDVVALEGRQFERFVGSDVPAGAGVRLDLPGSPGGFGERRSVLLVALAAGALALGILFGRRGARTAPRAVPTPAIVDPDHPDTLAQAIAALDAVRDRQEAAGHATPAAWEARRAELKARLAAALARSPGAPGQPEVDAAAGPR
ncbi:MAG TPA: hypothetical protein VLE53_12000 [Gemmatimonadaceae bacterium]|nr:hypothetical protein [Gemmatimonadaceae bacterium]